MGFTNHLRISEPKLEGEDNITEEIRNQMGKWDLLKSARLRDID